MIKQTISAIAVVSGPEWIWYQVGSKYNDRMVGEIVDKTAEFENSIEFMYEIRDTDGDVIAVLENCSVIVEYAKPEKAGEQA